MADPIRDILDSRAFTRQQADALRELARECPLLIGYQIGPATWTNQPAAATPLLGRSAGIAAVPVDLARYEQARLTTAVSVAGIAGSRLEARLATAAPTTAGSYTGIIATASIAATGLVDSGWLDIPGALRLAGWVDILGVGGDGAADPAIGTTCLWLR